MLADWRLGRVGSLSLQVKPLVAVGLVLQTLLCSVLLLLCLSLCSRCRRCWEAKSAQAL